jgi:hypothetical protein
MDVRRDWVVLAVGLTSICLAGCDPGYGYQPLDAAGNKVRRWSTTIAGVRFGVDSYGILTGSRGALMRLEIANQSGARVAVLGGQLETNGRTIEADLPNNPEAREGRVVPAGSTKTVPLKVDFGGQAAEVLGPSMTWSWRVRIGGHRHTVTVRMAR